MSTDSHSDNSRDASANDAINTNNNKSTYVAPWFQETLFKGDVTSKKNSIKQLEVMI